jgi:hypothetical protein
MPKPNVAPDQLAFMPTPQEEVLAQEFTGKLVDQATIDAYIGQRLLSNVEGTGLNAAVADIIEAQVDFDQSPKPPKRNPNPKNPTAKQVAHGDVSQESYNRKPFPYGYADQK